MKHITWINCINNDKHLASIIQLYVLIFNDEKYNSYEPFWLSMAPFNGMYIIYIANVELKFVKVIVIKCPI
jgi:hypothetical protein